MTSRYPALQRATYAAVRSTIRTSCSSPAPALGTRRTGGSRASRGARRLAPRRLGRSGSEQTPKRGGTVVVALGKGARRALNVLEWRHCGLRRSSPIAVLEGAFEACPTLDPPEARLARRPSRRTPFTLTYHIRPRLGGATGAGHRGGLRLHVPDRAVASPEEVLEQIRRRACVDAKTRGSSSAPAVRRLAGLLLHGHPAAPRARAGRLRGRSGRTDRQPEDGRADRSGPFLVESWERGRQLIVLRNPAAGGACPVPRRLVVVRFVGPAELADAIPERRGRRRTDWCRGRRCGGFVAEVDVVSSPSRPGAIRPPEPRRPRPSRAQRSSWSGRHWPTGSTGWPSRGGTPSRRDRPCRPARQRRVPDREPVLPAQLEACTADPARSRLLERAGCAAGRTASTRAPASGFVAAPPHHRRQAAASGAACSMLAQSHLGVSRSRPGYVARPRAFFGTVLPRATSTAPLRGSGRRPTRPYPTDPVQDVRQPTGYCSPPRHARPVQDRRSSTRRQRAGLRTRIDLKLATGRAAYHSALRVPGRLLGSSLAGPAVVVLRATACSAAFAWNAEDWWLER